MIQNIITAMVFQSTHPVRGATTAAEYVAQREAIFQSTHPVRGATVPPRGDRGCPSISIHAPREGCDLSEQCAVVLDQVISIHAPREGCDPQDVLDSLDKEFQSTHPVRGATRRMCSTVSTRNFNPRTP